MTRKPFGVNFETWIDKQIREATERGEMDNLPGAGKPLPGAGRQHDEQWWIKSYLKREGLTAESMLPTPLELRKEIERLPEQFAELRSEREVREVVADLNRRIVEWLRSPSGPPIRVAKVDVEAVVQEWKASRPVREVTPPPEPVRRARWWRRRT
jgi:hypothetical protein